MLEEWKYGLEELDVLNFNGDGIDLLIEQKRYEYRWENFIYLGEENYDN